MGDRELPNLNVAWGPHHFKWEKERDLNGKWGPTSFLNGRERVIEFEWSVGPTSF